ncbi:MAG: Recombinase, partial [Candidatus Magasanikbacteria bacterium GW2011_GWA2_46_17]
ELDRQLSSLIQKFSLRQDWATELNTMLEKEKTEAAQSSTAFVQEVGERIRAIQTKLQRLLDGYLEQVIEREIYRLEKAKLLSEKKSLEEQMARIEQKRTGWLEPMVEWIKEAGNLSEIARESNLFAKKVAAKEIFGSNLVLANREARLRAPSGEDLSGQNAWAALCAANEKVGQFPESQILVGEEGIEPSWIAPHDFESCASASSATRPQDVFYFSCLRANCQLKQNTVYLNYTVWEKSFLL